MCNNNSGLENQTGPELNSHCFLRSSPENRVSPRASPNHHISNGPFNKVAFELLTRGEGCVCVAQLELKKCSFCLLHAQDSNSACPSSIALSFPPVSFSPARLHPAAHLSCHAASQDKRASPLRGGCQTEPQLAHQQRFPGEILTSHRARKISPAVLSCRSLHIT